MKISLSEPVLDRVSLGKISTLDKRLNNYGLVQSDLPNGEVMGFAHFYFADA